MTLRLDDIKKPVEQEMEIFEKRFRQSMRSNVMLLDKITGYIVKRKGKQMRPLFVFLSAGVCGDISDATYRGASLIELLHTATLVHDDVVDDAHYRRGFFSINALWKNKIAVLVGDFLLSRGLLLSLDHNDFQLLKIVSKAVRDMSEGELLQMEKARKLDITEEIYFQVIRQKTASLITACCEVGASSAGAADEQTQKMAAFGLEVGMAFQIKDDLFDYGAFDTGKPAGLDIREKKLTLPLIYAISKSTTSEKNHILNAVKKSEKNPSLVVEIVDFVKQKGGIEYASQVMRKHYEQALNILVTFPESSYRDSLSDLVKFTIDRNK